MYIPVNFISYHGSNVPNTAVHNISDALATVTTDKDALVSAANALSTAFNDLVDNIDSTKSTCSASGVACDTACQAFDTDIMAKASADFSAVRIACFVSLRFISVKEMLKKA
ncbi:hypothetical protein DPMN_168033 [Dreissena polymorpha]|uniref:Uncharacterized protein n=1 Tax=Dreissena polymorpha TaxID=45954 RepID=A0A9D4IYX3_DREPO|nr:hypothetical protein DPMN_168033 [Dreissena polymorpha]